MKHENGTRAISALCCGNFSLAFFQLNKRENFSRLLLSLTIQLNFKFIAIAMILLGV
jgi:hypothetical protein